MILSMDRHGGYDPDSAGRSSQYDEVELAEAAKAEEAAWEMLPHLFNTWDEKESGKLGKGDLLAGVEMYCDTAGADFDSRLVLRLLSEVDTHKNNVLDSREFAVFIVRFSESMGITLDSLVDRMAEIAVDQAPPKYSAPKLKPPTKKSSWIQKRLRCEEPDEVEQHAPSWAELKATAEELNATKPSSIEKLRILLAARKARKIQLAASGQDSLQVNTKKKVEGRRGSTAQTILEKFKQPLRRLSMDATKAGWKGTDSRTVLDAEDDDGEHLLSVDQLENLNFFEGGDSIRSLESFPGYSYSYPH